MAAVTRTRWKVSVLEEFCSHFSPISLFPGAECGGNHVAAAPDRGEICSRLAPIPILPDRGLDPVGTVGMGTLLGTEDSEGTASRFCSGRSSDPELRTGKIFLLLMLDFLSVGSAVLTARGAAAVPSVPYSPRDLPV